MEYRNTWARIQIVSSANWSTCFRAPLPFILPDSQNKQTVTITCVNSRSRFPWHVGKVQPLDHGLQIFARPGLHLPISTSCYSLLVHVFLSMLVPFYPFPVQMKNVFIFYLTSICCILFALTSIWYIFPKLFSFLIPSQPSNLISDITWSRRTFLDTLAKCTLCYSVSFVSVVNFFSWYGWL